MSWNELSMADKANVMKLAIESGIYDLDTIREEYNKFANGGSIHIKPSHRGRLTELKKRTGKSEAELYNDGNPAHKKMVVFARNARKWKHGDGGNLFDDGGDKDNIFRYTNSNGNVRYVYQNNPEDEEVPVRPLNTIFPDPAQWTFTDDNGKFYTPRRTTPTSTAELNPDNRTEFERAVDNYIGEATNTIPKGYHTLPAIGAAALGLASPALGEAALTSGFGAHGLTRALNGDIHGLGDAAMTALEIAPLGRLARPVAKWASAGIENAITNKGFAVSTPYMGDYLANKGAGKFTAWVPFDRSWGRGFSWMSTGRPTTEGVSAVGKPTHNGVPVEMITSKYPGEARKLYDVGILDAQNRGYQGLLVGDHLVSAPKSYRTYEHYYPGRIHLDDWGTWSNNNMLTGKPTGRQTVYSVDDFIRATSENPTERVVFNGAPRYRLEMPSTTGTSKVTTPQITSENAASITRYDLPSSDIIIESSTSANPNIPFDEAWLAASKGRHQMSNLVGSGDYASRVRQAYQDNGIPINQADFEILQAKQGIKDSDLKVVPNLRSENGEVLNGQYDPNTRQVLVSQNRDNILDVVESSGHEHAHASEVEKLLELLKEKWKHIKPRKEAFTRSDGSIDTEWKDYISKTIEMRAPAMSVWSEMKELGFSKVGDYLHHLKRFGLEDKQWEALVNRYGLTNAKYMVETVFGLSPLVINGINNEEKDSTTM